MCLQIGQVASGMQGVIVSICLALSFSVTEGWGHFWILIGTLVSISYLTSFCISKASRLFSQVISHIVMHINLIQPRRILAILWIVTNVCKGINPSRQPNRIFTNKPSQLRVIKTCTVVEQPGELIALAAGVVVTCAAAA